MKQEIDSVEHDNNDIEFLYIFGRLRYEFAVESHSLPDMLSE